MQSDVTIVFNPFRNWVSVVRITHGPYYRGYVYRSYKEILPAADEVSVIREVSILERCQ